MSDIATELPRLMVFDAKGQPADVHVHDTHTTRNGRPVLAINGALYVVCEVE